MSDANGNLAGLFEKWGINSVLPKPVKKEKKEKEGFEPLSPTEYVDAYGNPVYLNRFSVGDDKISHFFIGSFTVVGLFILYRFMKK